MQVVFNPAYLLHCGDADFYNYLQAIRDNKENIPYYRLSAIICELLIILDTRNRENIQPLSSATLHRLNAMLCEEMNVMQE